MNGGGDQLARGAKSATFGPPRGISQEKWDMAFKDFHPKSETPNQIIEKEDFNYLNLSHVNIGNNDGK